ncbi:hypothetical protein OKA05_25290 [Luteolibacter arcticus]|uniref:WYL domain-containing protein n=1 Tax=Luteolibacter arcticus TaxID=1581411 RepID=A0ABT3GQY5_9BACT|nr:hypothetical protein [Luteolibacter arcticus]MCW1925899.1 hypothetical protein [Luteolibacter arcticus]
MRSRPSLAAIRHAILKRQRASFTHEKSTHVVADLFLLGQARRTAAYIVLAWCLEPEWGWRLLRFSEIWDFEMIGPVDVLRHDFNPYDSRIALIDTQVVPGRPTPSW